MRIWILSAITFFVISCSQKEPSKASIVERDYLVNLLENPSADKVQIINFWATWCAPCIEELPAFVDINDRNDVEVVLISLDDADNLESLVNPFLKENKITPTVKLLDDPYAAEWIPMVDAHWDGAIPATLIQKGSKKMFYNQSFSAAQLEDEVRKFL